MIQTISPYNYAALHYGSVKTNNNITVKKTITASYKLITNNNNNA